MSIVISHSIICTSHNFNFYSWLLVTPVVLGGGGGDGYFGLVLQDYPLYLGNHAKLVVEPGPFASKGCACLIVLSLWSFNKIIFKPTHLLGFQYFLILSIRKMYLQIDIYFSDAKTLEAYQVFDPLCLLLMRWQNLGGK